jgi:hypothetical protein
MIKSDTFQLTDQEWNEVGTYANSLIQNDMAEGIFQTPGGSSNKPTYNPQYAKYKANEMRRFGRTKIKTNSGIEYKGRVKAGTNKKTGATTGQRLKGYYGQPIESTNTSFVDMTVTGRLKKSLRVRSRTSNSVTSGYDPENSMKILGNQEKYGRIIVGLNDKNIELVKNRILMILKRKLQDLPKQINVNIKF